MDNIVEIIKQFEGIIGAILGSVATLVATELLRSRGKVKLYLKHFSGSFTKGGYDYTRIATSDQIPDSYDSNFSFQVYNGTDLPRVLKDIKVTFYENDKEVFSTTVINNGNSEVAEVLNINPKQIALFKYSFSIRRNHIKIIRPTNKIEMVYYDEKDKKHSLVLTDEPIENTGFFDTRNQVLTN